MPVYETEQLNWGIDTSAYSVDLKGAGLWTLGHGENWFEDSKGSDVGRFTFLTAGSWGLFHKPLGGNLGVRPLPKVMHLKYYDFQDNRAYQLDATLPQKQIYELLKADRVSTMARGAGDIWHYDSIGLGFAPQGHVMVWVGGNGENIEIAHYQAKPIPFSIDEYNKTAGELPINRLRELNETTTPETLTKIRSGKWTPSPDIYLQYRTKYPWKWDSSSNIEIVEHESARANVDRYHVFTHNLKKDEALLKSPPKWLDLYFNDKATGQRYVMQVEFWVKDRVKEEPDLSEIMGAFQQLFPNRTAANNDEIVPESEFATIRVDVSDDMKHASISVNKGNVHIPLNNVKYQFRPLPPHVYWYDSPPPSPEQLRNLQFGPSAKVIAESLKVKVDGICPKTGFWNCPQLEKEYTLFMRKGDTMPGLSYKMYGYDVDNMYWEFVKDA